MDTGSPELCLGPIAESYPPQCGGPALVGWDWADHKDTFEQQGDVRWGTYLVTGTWDGTVDDRDRGDPRRPLRPGDAEPSTPTPPAATAYTNPAAGGDRRASSATQLPGYLGSYGGEGTDGHVLADVLYDDGSLQEWADTTYGAQRGRRQLGPGRRSDPARGWCPPSRCWRWLLACGKETGEPVAEPAGTAGGRAADRRCLRLRGAVDHASTR